MLELAVYAGAKISVDLGPDDDEQRDGEEFCRPLCTTVMTLPDVGLVRTHVNAEFAAIHVCKFES
jgi:hypothetical protein